MPQTKDIIAQSLKEILQTKSLDKITIRKLVEECGINRQTFYYHFHDIYELVEYMFMLELEKILENPLKDEKTEGYHRWEEIYYTILYNLYENKVMTISVFHSIDKSELQEILSNIFLFIIMQIIDKESEGLNLNKEDKLFIANFYKYAFVGITLDWVDCLMKVKPDIVVRRASKLLERDIKTLLQNYCKNKR